MKSISHTKFSVSSGFYPKATGSRPPGSLPAHVPVTERKPSNTTVSGVQGLSRDYSDYRNARKRTMLGFPTIAKSGLQRRYNRLLRQKTQPNAPVFVKRVPSGESAKLSQPATSSGSDSGITTQSPANFICAQPLNMPQVRGRASRHEAIERASIIAKFERFPIVRARDFSGRLSTLRALHALHLDKSYRAAAARPGPAHPLPAPPYPGTMERPSANTGRSQWSVGKRRAGGRRRGPGREHRPRAAAPPLARTMPQRRQLAPAAVPTASPKPGSFAHRTGSLRRPWSSRFFWRTSRVGGVGFLGRRLHLLNNPVLKPGGLARLGCPAATSIIGRSPSTVYRLKFQFWGLNPLGFHLVNMALHAVSAFSCGGSWLRIESPGACWRRQSSPCIPVNVESVAWIAQLKGILSLLFALLSMLFYLRYDGSGVVGATVAAIAAFLCPRWPRARGHAAGRLAGVHLVAAGRIQRRNSLEFLPYVLIGGPSWPASRCGRSTRWRRRDRAGRRLLQPGRGGRLRRVVLPREADLAARPVSRVSALDDRRPQPAIVFARRCWRSSCSGRGGVAAPGGGRR